MSTLAERLGYSADDRLLIINCDDLGMCHSANEGVYDSVRNGLATSATLMVPCPWAREAASHYRGEDVGVHLTLNAEWELYRWGPITVAPALLDGVRIDAVAYPHLARLAPDLGDFDADELFERTTRALVVGLLDDARHQGEPT